MRRAWALLWDMGVGPLLRLAPRPAYRPRPRPQSHRPRLVLAALAGALAGLWSVGLVRFVRAEGVVEYQRAGRARAGLRNLAAVTEGVAVRASSAFRPVDAQHHPAFLFDEVAAPTRLEKWTSGRGDRAPWVEVRWPEPRAIERVVLYHAGWREPASYTARDYRVRCLDALGEIIVTNNKSAIARHELACVGARGVRLEVAPNHAGDLVRLYELEVWGR
jgi:hypothetical protein